MSEPEEPGSAVPRDPKVWGALGIVAIVLLSPLRAAEGTSPWPLALGLAAVCFTVAFGGWLVLRRTPPADD